MHDAEKTNDGDWIEVHGYKTQQKLTKKVTVTTTEQERERTLVNLNSKTRLTFGGTRSNAHLHFVICHHKEQAKDCIRNMRLNFQEYFTVKEMDLVIHSIIDATVSISNPSDLPSHEEEWRQIAHRRSNTNYKTEYVIKASMNLDLGEVTRMFPSLFDNNQKRRVQLYYHSLDTVHFLEVVFFLKLHPRFTNRYQLMSTIEDYIAKRFRPKKQIKVEFNSRMHHLGTTDRIEILSIFLTCGNDDVKLVTTAIVEMSKKNLLPGNSKFCGFDFHGAGEIAYRKILNYHTTHIKATKISSIFNIHTLDLEQVLHHKNCGFSLR